MKDSTVYVVMGVSGSGKTSVGRAVAQALGYGFIEGDSFHPPANIEKMSHGIPLEDADRFPWLDRIGEQIRQSPADGLVVTCSSLKRIYRDRLRGFAKGRRLFFIFLHGSEALLAERMARRKGHFMPASLLRSQLETLEDPTGEPDVVSVDIAGSTEDVVARTLKAITA